MPGQISARASSRSSAPSRQPRARAAASSEPQPRPHALTGRLRDRRAACKIADPLLTRPSALPPQYDAPVCKYRQLSEKLREKAGVPFASAKLELQDGSGTIVEFVRGKDLARYLRAHPEKMDGLVKPAKEGERRGRGCLRDSMHACPCAAHAWDEAAVLPQHLS